jgi:hypothetical protein
MEDALGYVLLLSTVYSSWPATERKEDLLAACCLDHSPKYTGTP